MRPFVAIGMIAGLAACRREPPAFPVAPPGVTRSAPELAAPADDRFRLLLAAAGAAEAEARANDDYASWQAAVDAYARAELAGVTDGVERATAGRNWAAARAAFEGGDHARALSLAIKVAAAKNPPAAAISMAASLGQEAQVERRRQEYEYYARQARAEESTRTALRLWQKAHSCAEKSDDELEALGRIMALELLLEAEEDGRLYERRLEEAEEAMSARDFERAWDRFELALSFDPTGPEARHGFDRIRAASPEVAYRRDLREARGFRSRQQWAKAKAAYRHALDDKPGDAVATEGLAEASRHVK